MRSLFEIMSMRRPCEGTEWAARALRCFDTTCLVATHDGAESIVHLPIQQRLPFLERMIAECTCFFVTFRCVGDVVIGAHLEVDDEAFGQQIQSIVAGEVYLIQLIASSWQDLHVNFHVPVPPHNNTCASNGTDLFPYQHESLARMARVEASASEPIHYEGNLRINDRWFLNAEDEEFTSNPSWREAHVRGGILADCAGSGKTAVALKHCCDNVNVHASGTQARGSLLVLPLNLPSHWVHEIELFCDADIKLVRMLSGKDVKTNTLDDLLTADIVITTFQFLRSSKPYQEMIEAAVQRHVPDRRMCRSRAALSAWARTRHGREPIVEAINWHRVVVDEFHEVLQPKYIKCIHNLRTTFLWGITATPDLESEHAQHLYMFLNREKAHHPNLLRSIMEHCIVRSIATLHHECSQDLRRIDLDAQHRAADDRLTTTALIRRCTHVGTSDDVEAWDVGDLVDVYERSLKHRRNEILTNVHVLQTSLDGVTHEPSEESGLRAAIQTQNMMLYHEEGKVEFVKERIQSLVAADEYCPICFRNHCGVITECGHLFCRSCMDVHMQTRHDCPQCRSDVKTLRGITMDDGRGRKLFKITDLLQTLTEPSIVFVQWKVMQKNMRAVFRGKGLRVFTLEGNASQRAKILSEFSKGGVLILSLDVSFSGLHLPHVRHVIFSHALVGDSTQVRRLEYQAIARCLRHGQDNEVYVHSFVINESVEEELWKWTHRDVEYTIVDEDDEDDEAMLCG